MIQFMLRIFLFVIGSACMAHAIVDDRKTDEYILGYVQGLFLNVYGLPIDAVAVRHQSIYIKQSQAGGSLIPGQLVEKIKQATLSLGVKEIIFKKDTNEVFSSTEKSEIIHGVMLGHSLFQPLIADPKWPRFTLAYQYFIKNRIITHAFTPNFGASFPVYRGTIKAAKWEVGVQGGLFAIMDIGILPTALVNADYYISLPFTFQYSSWSFLTRFYHESTHLGDEFMLTPQGKATERINLSLEGVDVLASYQFGCGIRLYGGGGYIVHHDPDSITPWKVQAGTEYRAKNSFLRGIFRPVAGLDIKSQQMSGWTPGFSFKAGAQLESPLLVSSEIQFMFEVYSGKSMHGQFYNDDILSVGLGFHAFL